MSEARRAPRDVGPLRYHAATRELLAGETVARLTGAEARLLDLLLPGGAVTREAVAAHALSSRHQPGQRGADALASRLRLRLAALSGGTVRVLAERGVGYRLAVDAPPPQALRARLTGAVERQGALVMILTAPAGTAALVAVGAEYEVRPAQPSSAA